MWQLEINYSLAFLYRVTGERNAEFFFAFVIYANGQMLFGVFFIIFIYFLLFNSS